MPNDYSDINMVETELIKNDYTTFKKNEENLHLSIDSNRFFEILENEFDISYSIISRYIDGGVFNFNEQHKFNIVLRRLKYEYNITILDSILYLEDCMDLQYILKFIDDETEWILRDELGKKYKIKIKSNIFDIFY